jgi:hypothetical protein
MENWVGSVEFLVECLKHISLTDVKVWILVTCPLVKLTSDRLTGHQATLAHEQPAFGVKGCNSKHDLLGAIFQHSLLTLFEKAKKEAHGASGETLQSMSVRSQRVQLQTYKAERYDKVDVPLLSRASVVTSNFIPCACRCGPVHS